jgi:AcrR family transcriptional regulator
MELGATGPSPGLRVYGGVDGDQRRAERRAQLIDAGLDLLGAADGGKLTVRGACQRAGVVARYFYESFADRDELAGAVYDHVVEQVARASVDSVDSVRRRDPGERPDLRARAEAGLTTLVDVIASDPRKGRVLFDAELSDPLIARRRRQSTRFFVELLAAEALTHTFLVGGMAEVLAAWLDGHPPVGRAEVVAHCTALFVGLAKLVTPR